MRGVRATALALGVRAVRAVPAPLSTMIGAAAATAAWVVDGPRRRAVDANLRRLVPGLGAAARRRLTLSTFRKKARAVVDVWRLTPAAAAGLVAAIEVSGQDDLRTAHAEGRGVIVVAPHLGPWDLGAAWFAAAGFRPCAVVEHLPGGAFEAHGRLRAAFGVEVVAHDRPRRLRQTLREGRVLILMADRVIAGRGRDVPFAGGVRAVPEGPAALARLTGAPVVGAWIAYDPSDGRIRAGLERVTAGHDEMTAAIGAWCASIAARFPDQWFVFQPGWRDDGLR